VSSSNVWRVLSKDLRLGPRSPIFLWALVLPIVLTVLIRGVFGGLFQTEPRLGILDLGHSEVTVAALELEGIAVTIYEAGDIDALLQDVENNDLDAGLILQPDFDEAVRGGADPELQLFIGGESLASDRIVIEVTAIDLIRGVSGDTPPVTVEVIALGDAGLDLSLRMLPLVVMYAVAIAGAFVPAMSLVGEKESGTVNAVLVTPTTVHEFMAAKVLLGVVLATLTGVMALLFNSAFGNQPLAVILSILIGALMMAEIGVMLGAWARDANTMFTIFKGGAILIFFPVIFYIWPNLPTWIAQLGPSYYFLQPIFELSVRDGSFAGVWVDLAIGVAICAALVPFVYMMGNWLQRRLGTGMVRPTAGEEPESEKELAGV
jgi:ABC-2 type transport system permease protein